MTGGIDCPREVSKRNAATNVIVWHYSHELSTIFEWPPSCRSNENDSGIPPRASTVLPSPYNRQHMSPYRLYPPCIKRQRTRPLEINTMAYDYTQGTSEHIKRKRRIRVDSSNYSIHENKRQMKNPQQALSSQTIYHGSTTYQGS